MEVKSKGVENWVDDIAIPTKSIATHWTLLRATPRCLRRGKLTVNMQKSKLCQSSM